MHFLDGLFSLVSVYSRFSSTNLKKHKVDYPSHYTTFDRAILFGSTPGTRVGKEVDVRVP